jgi:hypothetical protein
MEKRNTLIIGADVSHPSPGEDNGKPSIASVVASIDDDGYKFIGRLLLQDSRLEVIETLQTVVQEIIYSYKKTTGHHPKRILVYRDGVSEGQFAEILRTEVMAIKSACLKLDSKWLAGHVVLWLWRARHSFESTLLTIDGRICSCREVPASHHIRHREEESSRALLPQEHERQGSVRKLRLRNCD